MSFLSSQPDNSIQAQQQPDIHINSISDNQQSTLAVAYKKALVSDEEDVPEADDEDDDHENETNGDELIMVESVENQQ